MGDKGISGWHQQEALKVALDTRPAAAPQRHGEFMFLTASPPRSSDWLLIGKLISRLANRRESEPNLYSVSTCCEESVIKQLFYSVLFGVYF